MWKRLLDSDYFLCFGKDFEICVSNFVSIWYKQYSEKNFLKCLKESNFALEMDEKQLLSSGRKMLTDPERLKSVRINEGNDTLFITLTMSLGFPLKLKMTLKEGSKELFFTKVTLQLVKSVQDLHTSQTELRGLLKKKDLEIEEYKCEGGKIALRFLKTIPFNDEAHRLKHPVFSQHFNSSTDFNLVLDKSLEAPEMRVVKMEPTVVKREDEPAANGSTPSIKEETNTEVTIKKELSVKQEMSSEVCVKQELGEIPSAPAPSPAPAPSMHKPKRKKLNL